ncbi:signal transduction histidine kinase [Catenuloplanes nepalensis]|uniref:Oxygen sensor histidine kinase NreB n=1 Tax=Catenuloplanes nepalensis TaxID=587533 RepID=A0ABT9MX04_9ACTN|nr:sensor histidine kinase [Catenuloplanes nepalensis]MDP9795546.1 signal transduction histidine kinase [Catenuloplanes nepalensis]
MPRTRGWLGTPSGAIAAATFVIAVLSVIGQIISDNPYALDFIGLNAAIAVAFTAAGMLVLTGAPRHPVGLLMTVGGLSAAISVLAGSWTGSVILVWCSKWLWWPPFGLVLFALLLFPDGKLPSRRWRAVAWALGAAVLISTVGLAGVAADRPYAFLIEFNPEYTTLGRLSLLVALIGVAVTLTLGIAIVGSLWARWRVAEGDTRRQLACLIPAAILMVIGIGLDSGFGFPLGFPLIAVAVPIAMAVAILRYRLYGLDRAVNRTTVWLVMTLLVVVTFVAVVTALRMVLVGDAGNTNASLVATGLIAVGFEPVRRRVQQSVDQLLYGDRANPYKVIAALLDLLRHTAEYGDVLPRLTSAVAESLRLPYVAVALSDADGTRIVAEHGERSDHLETFAMQTHGTEVGRLLVGRRSPGARFTVRERRLLADVALNAAMAAEATRLIQDLRQSRERLVMAREEERRRLRRDLHDGVGPALTGIAMQVRAARKLSGPSKVSQILDGLTGDLQICTAEVRSLVTALRPPSLDRGLGEALRAECRRFDTEGLEVTFEADGDLTGLPAAVEVAAYRIVSESLNNVARHARASHCRVSITRSRTLDLEVIDDGVGLASSDNGRAGVGLQSMRERAEELGGECVIASTVPHGAAVRVHLPIAASA